MKLATKILSLIVLLSVTTFYVSCDNEKGGGKSAEEQQLDKLKAATWNMTSATLDGTPRTADFPGMTLTISGSFTAGGTYNYTIGGTTPDRSPWPRSGNWIFGSDPMTEIIRDPNVADETNLDYVLNDTQLVITFIIPTTSDGWEGGSRVNAVSGEWVFTFDKP